MPAMKTGSLQNYTSHPSDCLIVCDQSSVLPQKPNPGHANAEHRSSRIHHHAPESVPLRSRFTGEPSA